MTPQEGCKILAEHLAKPGVWQVILIRNLICEVIGEQPSFSSIMTWNDAPERTLEEVLTALNKAANL